MGFVKEIIRTAVRSLGYDIKRYTPPKVGYHSFSDMSYFLKDISEPVLFDVGANVGQTVRKFRERFSDPVIHSFEPSPGVYEQLKAECGDVPGVHTWNCALGDREGTLPFLENSQSVMSSFRAPGALAWGEIVGKTEVEVRTVDRFAEEHRIDFIHLLKSDTQGFDFEVLRGAEQMMKEHRIALIYFECIFSDQYEDLPPFYDILEFLVEQDFSIVNFYNPYFQEEILSWNDVLLIDKTFHNTFRDKKQDRDTEN